MCVCVPHEFVGLSQQRVEGFSSAMDSGGVGRDCKSCHIAHLLQRALTFSSLVQQLVVLQVLRETLQHGEWLIEVHLIRTTEVSMIYSK